jgi:peptidoglycan/xylan/chitin deacetylase (PgdA/CDA1 family)
VGGSRFFAFLLCARTILDDTIEGSAMKNYPYISFCLSVLFVLTLSACSGGSDTVDEPTGDVTTEVNPEDVSGETGQVDTANNDVGVDHCDPGQYTLAKNGRCYLCNPAGDGVAGPGEEVDDENPCTDEVCDPEEGVQRANNDNLCDDGNTQTALDTCTNGDCLGIDMICTPEQFDEIDGECFKCLDGVHRAEIGIVVDDENPCTDDACEAVDGAVHTPNNDPCDDGDPETYADTCNEGQCVGASLACPPGEYFEQDALCFLCEDDGLSYAEEGADIDDGNPCTDDSCLAADGVTHENNDAQCDDENPDTGNDTCLDGLCTGTAIQCAAGKFLQDNGVCYLCNEDGSAYEPGGVPLDDGNVCTDSQCDPETGVLVTYNSAECDDGDPDTVEDMCVDGACLGVTMVCPADEYFEQDGACLLCDEYGTGYEEDGDPVDDGDECTDDACDKDLGVVHTDNTAPCDDGNPDTGNDTCFEGECEGIPILCDPGLWVLDNGLCQLCSADGSGYEGDGVVVDDGNPCTDDLCDPDLGAGHSENAAPCDDLDPCTDNDICAAGSCQGAALDCADDNDCTLDSCAEGLCQNIPNTALPGCCDEPSDCADEDDCTEDLCVAFACENPVIPNCGMECVPDGPNAECDDGNDCTDDLCAAGICTNPDNSAGCDDADPCTEGDICGAGVCAGTPIDCDDNNGCTVDSCQAGVCQNIPDGAVAGCCGDAGDCADGDDCTEDLCINFACQNPEIPNCGLECFPDGPHANCDDENVCTDDICADGACTNVNNAAPCDDGNPNTVEDACNAGQCVGIPEICAANQWEVDTGFCRLCNANGTAWADNGEAVDDGNLCTDDWCAADAGAQHVNNTVVCDDGNAGTVNDVCENGACSGTPVVCPSGEYYSSAGLCYLCNVDGTAPLGAGVQIDDGNLCTNDVCDPDVGVTNSNNSVACDDGNPDTVADQCANGVCSGLPKVCEAGDYFAADGVCFLCNGDGTGPVGNGEVIDDNNVCTGEKCSAGGGVIRYNYDGDACDDGDPETELDLCFNGECTGTFTVCVPWDYYDIDGKCELCNPTGDGYVGGGEVIDDGDVCTTDVCDQEDGFYRYNSSADCDDGDPNTGNDHCSGGICAGDPIICPPDEWVAINPWWCQLCDGSGTDWANSGVGTDDENDCTDDSCDPQQGVVHTNSVGECWDENVCTQDDFCSNGICTGTPVVCDDSSVCTADSCDPDAGGCVYSPVDNPCDDGVDITLDDTCVNGECVGMLDADGDGIPNYGDGPPCSGPGLLVDCVDNCPFRANANQADSNNDGKGDECTDNVRFWMRVKTTEKVVALTFDDGWSNDALEGTLDALDAGGANASFFLMGKYVSGGTLEPETMARLNNSGYIMGNHSFSGTVGTNAAECAAEIIACEEAFLDAGIPDPKPLYRLPDPDPSQPPLWVYPAMLQTGYSEQILANFDLSDWLPVTPSADAMVQCVLDQVEPGDILSMHIGPDVTVEALPAMIQGLKDLGYELLTVEQIMSFGDPEYFLDLDLIKTCTSYIQ